MGTHFSNSSEWRTGNFLLVLQFLLGGNPSCVSCFNLCCIVIRLRLCFSGIARLNFPLLNVKLNSIYFKGTDPFVTPWASQVQLALVKISAY